jgi:hypothetical protein
MWPDLHLNISTMSAALAVLTAMITPALLISACGTFVLSTSNRLARVVDRMRALTREVEELSRMEGEVKFRRERLDLWQSQIQVQGRRLHLLQRALTLLYVATCIIVFASVSLGLVTALGSKLYWFPVALGLLGASFFLAATILLVSETKVAVQHAYNETELLLELARHYATAGPTAVPDPRPPAIFGR